MENRDQQNRFLQPIKDSDRQGERNPRVFLKAKAIPASSQLNPDRDKIFKFSGQPLPNPKFGQDNLQKIFRFGALQELTPTLNISQDCVGKNPALSHFPTSISFGVPICHSSPAVHPVPFLFQFGEDKSTHGPQVNIFTSSNQRENMGLAPVVEPLQPIPGGKAIKREESTTAAPDYELKSLGATCNGPSVSQFSSASNADDDEEYQYYRDRVLGKSYLDSQFSYASDAEDDEAEYQYYRHRALGLSPRPLSEQNTTDTRGSRLGFAPFSPSSIGCSAEASTAFIPAPVSIPLDGAPASSAQGFRYGGCNAEYNPMLSLARRHSNVWKCHFVAFGNVAQQQYCRTVHLSLETLSQPILGDSGIINLLEKLLTLLQIQGCFPLGFSQQYEYQQDRPDKVLFVEGGWRCNFFFRVEATHRDLQHEWTSVEIRVCPAPLLNAIRQQHAPLIFQATTPQAAQWMSRLHDIAIDPVEGSRGLLGHFSAVQMISIESLFATMGVADPWTMVINPLWAALLEQVGEAWSSTETGPSLHPSFPPEQARWPLMWSSLDTPAGDTAERPYMRCVSEALPDGSADSPHAGAPLPTPTQLSCASHDHQMLYLGRPGQSNFAAPNISCPADTQIMPEDQDDDWDSDSDLSADDAYPSSWSARICYTGSEQDSFCTTQGLPSEILDTTWSASCLDTLIERIGSELHIPDLAPVGMSHQLQQQRDSSRRTLYVKGSWRCSLLFDITAPLGDVSRFSELELRICPAALLQATQRDAMSKIFEGASNGIAPTNSNLLDILRRIAEDGTHSFRGWLGFFSSKQCASIASIGSVPWSTVVYPLWDKIIAAVATAWTTAQLHTWEVQHRPYLESPPDHLLPAAASPVASSHLEEPPENVRARPQTVESPEAVLASPQAEALVEPVQVAPLPQEPLQPVYVEKLSGALRRDLEEEPSSSVSLSPRKLLRNAFAVLGSFPLQNLFPLMPSWSRPKWWLVYSHRAFQDLYRAPSSTPGDTAGVSSTWPPRYNVTTSLCGLLRGSSRGGTRVPFYLVGDVVGV